MDDHRRERWLASKVALAELSLVGLRKAVEDRDSFSVGWHARDLLNAARALVRAVDAEDVFS